jgi:zinc transport system permease protein
MIDTRVIMEMLSLPFMQRALIAAVLVGLAAPAVGTYLVQRRLALMGDGIGHVALTGVALGFLLGTAPVLTAVVVAIVGAVAMELIRERARVNGDVALAMLFYGGIAGGVLLIGLSDNGSASLLSYLFGSLTTVATADVWVIAGLTTVVLATTLGLRRALFALCLDEEFAKVAGLPVRWLNIVIAVTAALTVTVAMRVVGLLLVSALMVMPVATSQQFCRSFAGTLRLALGIGVAVSIAGVTMSYYADVAPGATIVVLAVGAFVVAAAVSFVRGRVPSVWGRNPVVAPGVASDEDDDDVAVRRR